jgi:tetratricopeptide (TPR) repeat protein
VPTLPPRYSEDLEIIGQGGFATVYRTRDELLDRDVAIKLPFKSGDGDLAREVTTELQATAVVRHPNIIQVLDVGTTGEGDPFLVLELATAGSLAGLRAERDLVWSEIEPLLVGILDGLGHAHAHGLVHRDIKPANVLLDRTEAGDLRARISDLGLAKVLDRHGDYRSTRLLAGTVLYMAPEQFEQDLAAIHPGVDLYAFGVLTYQLVTGRAPWEGGSELVLLFNKANRPLRPFVPRLDCGSPPGLGAVVERLLAPEPADRFRLASDARAAILALSRPVSAEAPTRRSDRTDRDPFAATRSSHVGAFPLTPPEPPIPGPAPPTAAVAAVRTPLLVGRTAERRQLWEAARRACADPVGVTVLGGPGVGRTRLATWLGASLEEAALARTLRVQLDRSTTPNEGLRSAIRRHFALGRLSGDRLAARLVEQVRRSPDLGPDDAETLHAFLEPDRAPASNSQRRDGGRASRDALVERLLFAEARRGLVCLRIEESSEVGGAELAAAALRSCRARAVPALILYEPPAERVEPQTAVHDFEPLEVGPMEAEPMHRLVRDVLPPDGDLDVDEVVRRARGNPSVAVEWARLSGQRLSSASRPRRTPVAAPDWLALATEVPEHDPSAALGTASVRTLVVARLATFFASSPHEEGARRLLTLLVLLPRPVSRNLLQAAFLAAGDAGAFGLLLDEVQAAGLVRSDALGRLDVVTPQLGDALLELAAERPDLADLRLACAGLLLDGGEAGPRATEVHAARLLLEGGDFERALDVSRQAGERLLAHDLAAARAAFEIAGQAAQALDLPPEEPRHFEVLLSTGRAQRNAGQFDRVDGLFEALDRSRLPPGSLGWLLDLEGSVAVLRGELDEAMPIVEEARLAFEAAGDSTGLARVVQLGAEVAFRQGRTAASLEGFERAMQLAREAGSASDELGCLWRLARLHRSVGETALARTEFQRALATAEDLGDRRVQAIARRELGNLALVDGELDRAEELLQSSAELLERGGFPTEAATTRLSLGEAARARGRLREARDAYSAALATALAYGLSGTTLVALIDLAIVELAMGRSRRATKRLVALDEQLLPGTAHRYRPYVEAVRAGVSSANGDWDAAEDAVESLEELDLPPDPDLVTLVEGAGASAAAQGQTTLALDAWQLGLEMCRRAGDADAEARLRAKLVGLGT